MGQIMTKHAKEFGFILKETGACSFLLFISCTHNVWGGGGGGEGSQGLSFDPFSTCLYSCADFIHSQC